MLLHLQRQHLLEWVRAMIAVTLGVGLDSELPPVLLQDETDNAWNQISELICGLVSCGLTCKCLHMHNGVRLDEEWPWGLQAPRSTAAGQLRP